MAGYDDGFLEDGEVFGGLKHMATESGDLLDGSNPWDYDDMDDLDEGGGEDEA
jgi:hypothetical protein